MDPIHRWGIQQRRLGGIVNPDQPGRGGSHIRPPVRLPYLNNEAEYEALLVGLWLAKQMGAEAVTTLTDSRLAANQINGSFEAKDKRMEKYVKIAQWLIKSFNKFVIKHITRSENKRADALSKLASTCFDHLSKKVLVEVLKERSVHERQVNTLATSRRTWMAPLIKYLQHGDLLDSHEEARKIRIKAPSYTCERRAISERVHDALAKVRGRSQG